MPIEKVQFHQHIDNFKRQQSIKHSANVFIYLGEIHSVVRIEQQRSGYHGKAMNSPTIKHMTSAKESVIVYSNIFWCPIIVWHDCHM